MFDKVINFFWSSSKPTDFRNVSPDNWVRMRFWIPQQNKEEKEEATNISTKHTEKNFVKGNIKNVGHVSVETSKIYASIWPDSEETTSIGLTSRHKVFFMPSPQKDEEAEGRPPDYIVDLYSLKVTAIEETFNQLKEKTRNWQLLGRNKYVGTDGQSCAGQTFELLEVSGLTEKISVFNTIKPTYFYASPASILNMVMAYKNYELEKFPQVKDFNINKYANEYNAPLDNKNSSHSNRL